MIRFAAAKPFGNSGEFNDLQWFGAALACASMVVAAAAQAESPRELLTQASFVDRDKGVATRRVGAAYSLASQRLGRNPGDREAALMQATALGYRAKLTGSRADAIAARRAMEALVQRHPQDAERHLVLGAWHMGAVHRLGRIVARAALGASKPVGLHSLDRAVTLGGDRAMFPGIAALLRIEMDADDPRGRELAEAAVRAAAPTALDRHVQRAAQAVLAPVRAGDGKAAKRLAARLLPFGHIDAE